MSIQHKNKFIIITGCSSGGKSTLIKSLKELGYTTTPEAGRIIVQEQNKIKKGILPWSDPMGFCELLIEKSILFFNDAIKIQNVKGDIIFFDRSFLDAVSYYTTLLISNNHKYDSIIEELRFHSPVFMVPPWKEIYENDDERKHSFEDAALEYNRLKIFYPKNNYDVIEVPKLPVEERINFILLNLSLKK